MNTKITHLLLFVLSLIAIPAIGQTGFNCDSNLYQVVDGKDLKVLDPVQGTYTTIGTSSFSYNGAGYNSDDGFIYGIGSNNTLIKVDNSGEGTDLGTISGFSALSYSGDFDIEGNWYSFRKSGSSWIMNKVDVSELPAVAENFSVTALGSALTSSCADISFNSVTKKFYGMNAGVLMEFDHLAKTVKVVADYSNEADYGGYGAVWSDNQGNSYFFNNSTGNIYKAKFNEAGEILSFGFTAVSSPNGSNDGMSCPLSAPPVFPEICDNGLDDDGDGLIDCEDPDCYSSGSCGVSGIAFSSETACENSIVSYHTFFTNKSTLTNTITVTDVLPTGFTFLQDTIEFDQAGFSDFSLQPVTGDEGTIKWGNITLEGGETVRISYDVTLGENVTAGNNGNQITLDLGLESTVFEQTSLSTQVDIMETCPPPNTFDCEPAFYQVYKKKGKNQPNVYGKLNPVTGDYDQIAIASDYANGLGFDINSGLVYGASGKNFIQLDEDGLVIDQGITFSKNVYRGDINDQSEWYGVVGNDVVKIDVSGTPQILATYAGQGLPGWDISFNTDGHFYSIHNNILHQFNTSTNTKSTVATILGGIGVPANGGYGAQWTGSDGYLYASHNSTGKIIRINVTDGSAIVVSNSVSGLSKNDGFSCPLAIPAVFEFDYSDNSRLPQARILSYRQDISQDGLPDFSTVWLGNTVAFDAEDPSNLTADGDNDDGANLNTRIKNSQITMQFGLNSNIDVTCHYILGVDWNDDGTFDSTYFGNQAINGAKALNIDLSTPEGFITGNVNIRMIVSEMPMDASNLVGDLVFMGEVEDYRYLLTSDEDCTNGIDDDADGLTDCDDPDCSGIATCPVTPTGPGGGDGGLESNDRLSDKIARVQFNRKRTVSINYDNKDELEKMEKGGLYGKKRLARALDENSIEKFIPIDILPATETFVTSPNHLIDITNATEVFSADVFEGESRVAAVLALSSENGVYEHTKYVCDRLNGSEIEDILSYKIDEEHTFQLAKLKLPGGNREYATSFSVRVENDTYVLESFWNLAHYTPKQSYYNFQIWANSTTNLIGLVNEILALLKVQQPISKYMLGEAPAVFVNKAELEGGILNIQFTNKTGEENLVANGTYRESETSEANVLNEAITLGGNIKETKELEIGSVYDLGLTFHSKEESMSDVIFMADGAWGTDYDENVESVTSYEILPGYQLKEDNYTIERNIEIAGTLTESVAVFRAFNPSFRPVSLTDYNTLSFDASGEGTIEITLVKSSIRDWAKQPRVTINLTEETTSYDLYKNYFKNEEGSDGNWEDLTMIVFDVKGDMITPKDFRLNIGEVNFRYSAVTATQEMLNNTQLAVYPNPAREQVNISFHSNVNDEYSLEILDQSGKICNRFWGMVVPGKNVINAFGLPGKGGLYFYRLSFGNGEKHNGKLLLEE